MSDQERQRFEREIDEIIQRKGGFLTGPKGQESVKRKPARHKPSTAPGFFQRFSFNPGRMVVSGIALLVVVALLSAVMPPSLRWVAVVVAVGLFLGGYVLSFTRPGGVSGGEKRWRGQVIHDGPDGPSFDDLKRLFKRKKK